MKIIHVYDVHTMAVTKQPSEQSVYLGLAEVADLAGVGKSAICMRRKRDPNFPAPVAELAQGPIFLYVDIRYYFYRHYQRGYKHLMSHWSAKAS